MNSYCFSDKLLLSCSCEKRKNNLSVIVDSKVDFRQSGFEKGATGATRDVQWRKQQLKGLRAAVQKWEKPLTDALRTDLHKSYEEAYLTEIGLVYGEISDALKHVGNSGMGSYYSERSFLAFSHERSVLRTPTCVDLKVRYMPYKMFRMVRKLLK